MNSDPTGTADQRGSERREARGSVELIIDASRLGGNVNNVSPGGIMLTADGGLRVTVEFNDDGERVRRTGVLSRVQRMNADEAAYAIEFDPED